MLIIIDSYSNNTLYKVSDKLVDEINIKTNTKDVIIFFL